MWGADECGTQRTGVSRLISDRTHQAEVDQLRHDCAVSFTAKHYVRRLDVAVDKLAMACRNKCAGDLQGNIERGPAINWAFAADPVLDGFAIDEFHRVKIVATFTPEMEH